MPHPQPAAATRRSAPQHGGARRRALWLVLDRRLRMGEGSASGRPWGDGLGTGDVGRLEGGGAHRIAHDRFQEWVEAGVFLKLWQAGVERFDELKGLDWNWLSRGGAMTKAPLGGGKDGAESDRPGQRWGQAQLADRG